MRKVARLSDSERKELFMATAEAMKVHQAIAEKDFWVCWILDYLFQESPWKDSLAFKGGTSLSKAYGAIERFSEDIDLILDWKLLGYRPEEAWATRSSTQQDKFGKDANRKTAEYLSSEFGPELDKNLKAWLGGAISVTTDEQNVLIDYPRAFSLQAIQPQVRLEIGPLAEAIPNEPKEIAPFAAQKFPQLFSVASTTITTVKAERTFWEKATILHQEANRGKDRSLPPRYSRHYYDLYRLSRLAIRESALSNISLLQEVAAFKMRFYRCPWAKYEEAKAGTLKLIPPDHHINELKRDYQAMEAMLFGEIPSFDEIMEGLSALEREVNGLVSQ